MKHDNVDDLIALGRRGLLSEPEVRRVGVALQTSESARALHEVGLSFDASSTELAGDSELLARVQQRVVSRVLVGATRTSPPRRRRFLLVTSALFMGGAAAAAMTSLVLDRGSDVGKPATAAQPAAVARPPDSGPGPASSPANRTSLLVAPPEGGSNADEDAPPSHAAELDPAPPATKPPRGDVGVRPLPANEQAQGARAMGRAPGEAERAPSEPVAQSAAGLFRAANAARKAGNAASALSRYEQLQRMFPASSEARVSRVLSGRLLLGMGRPERALGHFDRYLSAGGEGSLAEEALWGKAQALKRLGRVNEERNVWQTLLRRFPKSVYAAAARQRLQR